MEMLIKELHNDIERYLKEDCYCPHEIYSFDGFYYQLFYEDQQCEKIGEIHNEKNDMVACIAHPNNDEKSRPQIVVFMLNGDKCYDAIRYDATENNLKITKDFITNGINGRKFKFDEYEPGSMAKSIKEIMDLCNGVVMVD